MSTESAHGTRPTPPVLSCRRRAALAVALSLGLGVLGSTRSPRLAVADTLLLRDGRTIDCAKIEKQADGKWKLSYKSGDVVVPPDFVKDALCVGDKGYEPKDDEEKAKLAKGLVPFEGKWIPKAERDTVVARRTSEARKRIDEAKAHHEWRNRYKTKTQNFEFEYTIPPEIAKGYMDLMETYYAYFTKQFGVTRPAKEKPLKVCFYHDYDTFLETAGAGYGVLAYYRFVPPRELDFYYDRLQPDVTTAIMFHEAQHYLANLFDLKFRMPHAFGESMAEYYGASSWDPVKKTMTPGGIQEGRLTEVQTDIQGGEKWGLEKLLLEERTYEHYTWGWTLVHFLMETKKYHDRFLKFYRGMADAKDIVRTAVNGMDTTVTPPNLVKAFKKYMGVDDLATLEKEWHDYVENTLKLKTALGYEKAAFAAANTGRTIKAKRFFKLAVDAGSKNPTLYLRYGETIAGEDPTLALDLFRRGLEIDPLNSDLYIAMGRRIRAQGGAEKEAEGKRLIELARDIDPDNAEVELLYEEAVNKVDPPSAPKPGDDGGDK